MVLVLPTLPVTATIARVAAGARGARRAPRAPRSGSRRAPVRRPLAWRIAVARPSPPRRRALQARRRRNRGRRAFALEGDEHVAGRERAACRWRAGDAAPTARRGARRRAAATSAQVQSGSGIMRPPLSAARDRVVIGERHARSRRRSGRSRGPCRRPAARRPAAAGDRAARSPRRGRRSRWRRAQPARISARMAAASLAARIVVGDDDVVGLAGRRRRPSSGRLPLSRSPPQPNTHHEPAARIRAAARRAPCERIGRVGVVDEDRRRRRRCRRARGGPCAPCRLARPAARSAARPGRHREAGGDQRVGRLEGADQRQAHARARRPHARPSGAGRSRRLGSATSRRSSPARGRPHDSLSPAPWRAPRNARRPLAVGIDDGACRRRQQLAEQAQLGVEIGLEVG